MISSGMELTYTEYFITQKVGHFYKAPHKFWRHVVTREKAPKVIWRSKLWRNSRSQRSHDLSEPEVKQSRQNQEFPKHSDDNTDDYYTYIRVHQKNQS